MGMETHLCEHEISVRNNTKFQEDAEKIFACITVLLSRATGARDGILIDDVGSFASHLNDVKGACKAHRAQKMNNKQSKVSELMLEILRPYLRNFKLSDTQIEISILILRGFSSEEIVSKLYMSERNLAYHKREILDKMQLDNFRDYIAEIREVYESSFA